MAELVGLGHLAQVEEQRKGTAMSMCGAETTGETQRNRESRNKSELSLILSVTMSHTTKHSMMSAKEMLFLSFNQTTTI